MGVGPHSFCHLLAAWGIRTRAVTSAAPSGVLAAQEFILGLSHQQSFWRFGCGWREVPPLLPRRCGRAAGGEDVVVDAAVVVVVVVCNG